MIKSNKLLIIGKVPLPIGGVTIHVKRLLEFLDKKKKISYSFYNLKTFSLLNFLSKVYKHRYIHIHSSNSFLLLFVALLSKLFKNKLILTFHGNFKNLSYSRNPIKKFISNFFLKLSIKISNIPIVLNKQSFKYVKKINSKTRLIPAFIPPLNEKKLSIETIHIMKKMKKNHNYIFSSNAFDFSYDSYGNEIYGITQLINFFKENINYAFILSDPSGNYSNYFKTKNIKIGKNIFIINRPHSFFNILKYCDVFIRNTSSDGDSLSIKEALFLNVNVIASDCVDRPPGVINFKFNDNDSLEESIKNILNKKSNFKITKIKNGALELLKLYKKTLN